MSTPTPGKHGRVRSGLVAAMLVASGGLVTASAGTPTVASVLVPITPCRLLDTRAGSDNVGTRATPVGPNDTFVATARGANGNCIIPVDATALSMNVAIVNPTSASFLTVFPSDAARPLTANLNWVARQAPTPNAVTSALSADGKLGFYNLSGSVDIAVDVFGYYQPSTSGPAGPVGPAGPANRISDAQIAQLRWDQDPGRNATITVGGHPIGMTFDGANIWVSDDTGSTLTRIDPATGATTPFPAVTSPRKLTFDGTNVWAANSNASISKFDIATGERTDFPSTGPGFYGIAFDGTSLWVTIPADGKVARIDRVTGARDDFAGFGDPLNITFDGRAVWVTSGFAHTVSRIDPNPGGFVMSIPTPVLHPSAVASDGTNIWVTLEDVGKVRKLDRITGAAIGDFATGLAPLALAFDGTSMVVANASSATVSAIDPNGVAPGHPIDRRVGAGPSAVVYDGTNIWVANYDDGTVSKLTP